MRNRIAAVILLFCAAIGFSQPQTGGFGTGGNSSRNGPSFSQYAFFEFAPISGRGMGSACSCASVTGAKGEALTFSRTGDATCSKQGLATTGIANGDLVVCTANQPRIESSGGVLGLRVEGARTNETLRSQQIENAVWATTVAGVAAPTITADFATAPDGTTTADRMQIPACPVVGNASGINQTSATIASPSTSSVYMKANAGNPSISVCMYGITTGTRTCTQFALNTSTWTRAVVPNVTNTGGMNVEIACENRTASYTGATDTGAADILVWGAQSEAGAYATSYIPTVAAAVTRNAETATLPIALSTGASFSIAESFAGPSTVSACAGFFAFSATTGPSVYTCFNTTNVFRVASVATADSTSSAFSSLKWNTGIRWGGSWDRASSVATAYTDGIAGTPSAATPGVTSVSWTALSLTGDGIHSRVCADSDITRCR